MLGLLGQGQWQVSGHPCGKRVSGKAAAVPRVPAAHLRCRLLPSSRARSFFVHLGLWSYTSVLGDPSTPPTGRGSALSRLGAELELRRSGSSLGPSQRGGLDHSLDPGVSPRNGIAISGPLFLPAAHHSMVHIARGFFAGTRTPHFRGGEARASHHPNTCLLESGRLLHPPTPISQTAGRLGVQGHRTQSRLARPCLLSSFYLDLGGPEKEKPVS